MRSRVFSTSRPPEERRRPDVYDLSQLLRSNTKFKHLKLVVAISERAHIGKVAEQMHLSQPAVSKALAEIESLVGVRLFERTPAGLVETAYGKVFVAFAREMLSRIGRVGDELTAVQQGYAGTVHAGAQITGTAVLIPLAVKLLKQRSPTTTVRLDDGLIEPLMEQLLLGQLDIVIGRLDTIPDMRGVAIETLYQDPVVLVAASGAPITLRRELDWHDLNAYPWILPPPGSSSRRRFDDVARQLGLSLPTDLVETSSFVVMLTLMRERDTVCLLPQRLARYCEAAGLVKVLPVPALHVGSPIGLVSVEDRHLRPSVVLFIDCLREATAGVTPEVAPGDDDPRRKP